MNLEQDIEQTDGDTAEEQQTATLEEPTFAEYKRFRETGELDENGNLTPKQGEEKETHSEAEGEENSEAETAGEADTPETEKDQTGNRRKPTAEQRIRELTRKRREAENRAAELEEQLRQATARREETPKGGQAAGSGDDSAPPRPKAEDFESYEDLEKALDEWRDQMIDYKLEKRLQAESARARAAERTERLASRWEEQSQSAREKYEDFDDALAANNTDLPEHVTQALLESDCGAELAYYLATHGDELESIVKSGTVKGLKALGVLEARFLEPSKPKRNTSKAPPPPVPVGRGKSSPKLEDVHDFAEYKKRRRHQAP